MFVIPCCGPGVSPAIGLHFAILQLPIILGSGEVSGNVGRAGRHFWVREVRQGGIEEEEVVWQGTQLDLELYFKLYDLTMSSPILWKLNSCHKIK